MTQITMPRLSDSMEEGTILKWLKEDAENIAPGDDLVEIETDKASMTYAAEAEGTLQIVVAEGSTVPVGSVIANIVAAAGVAAADVPTYPPDGMTVSASSVADSNGHPPAGASVTGGATSPPATPLARRAAETHGVALQAVDGTGPRGRITRADVLAAAGIADRGPAVRRPSPRGTAPADPAPPATETPTGDFDLVEPTSAQRVVARRMAEATRDIPDFEVQTDVVMDETLALRARLKELARDEPAPTINDFIVKACAAMLRRHPRVNGSYAGGRFALHRRVSVGVAVAADDALIVPVVHDADTKSLGAIARETRCLAGRVRNGEITPPELAGGTFTVSNLGMFGMTVIHPVINPPQAAILGVGAIRQTLVRVDGEIRDRQMVTLTLTADHRILYGADAAGFLADVRAVLEAPLRLAL